MEHLVVSILGPLLLPVFLIALVAAVMGIKPEAILMPLFSLFGVIFKLCLDLAIVLARIIGGGVVVMIARIFNVR